MLCIYNKSTEPFFNMAVEEYLFKNFKDNIFMLWQNDNAIIVGKHQNTLSEINLEYVKDHKIKVVRRLSGGGAVYHDLGNLNFTFITNAEGPSIVDFKGYTQPIIDILRKFGIEAKFEGRNDLTIDGKKFSGNAVHVVRNRVMHHGTILFSSILEKVSNSLKVNPLKYKDKTVKSVRSRVTNVNEHLKEEVELPDFIELVMKHVFEMYSDARPYELSEDDKRAIQVLADNKYSTWEWNYGYQAKYNFEKLITTGGGSLEFHMDVVDGLIVKVQIFGDFFSKRDISDVEKILIGVRHDEHSIRKALKLVNFEEYFRNISLDEFISGMF